MSFFSSLILFHPNPPPIIKGVDLIQFATTLRNEVGVKDDSRCSASLKYGERIDQDYETTNLMDWHESAGARWGTFKEYKWDKKYDQLPWADIVVKFAKAKKNVYRAHLSLGWLTKDSCTALTRWSDKDPRSGICPDSLSIEIDPICPTILSDEALVCTGLVSINFPGNGYFSWEPTWQDYAEQYREAKPVVAARSLTRSIFPVIRGDSFDKISEHLGPRFLNRDYYKEGDWVLSVNETG